MLLQIRSLQSNSYVYSTLFIFVPRQLFLVDRIYSCSTKYTNIIDEADIHVRNWEVVDIGLEGRCMYAEVVFYCRGLTNVSDEG